MAMTNKNDAKWPIDLWALLPSWVKEIYLSLEDFFAGDKDEQIRAYIEVIEKQQRQIMFYQVAGIGLLIMVGILGFFRK